MCAWMRLKCLHVWSIMVIGNNATNYLFQGCICAVTIKWMGAVCITIIIRSFHYNDVIMSTMASQITAQMASNAENVSIWWRHHVEHGSLPYTSLKWKQWNRIEYIYIYNVNGATKITEWYCTLCVETSYTIPSCVVLWYVISNNWIKSWKNKINSTVTITTFIFHWIWAKHF